MLCKECGGKEEVWDWCWNELKLPWCKTCYMKLSQYGEPKYKSRIYNALHKEERKEYQKQYYQKNKEALKAKATQWRKDNKQKHSEYRKKYYQANKDKIKATQKKYNEKNKEKIRQYQKEYVCKKRQSNEKLIEELYQKVADLQYENKLLKENGR